MDHTPPPRLTPEKAFKEYGLWTLGLLVLMVWFAYDGWYNPDIQSKTFNKVGAVLLGLGALFCAVMAGSAWRTLRRQRQQPPPSSPPAE